MAFKRGNVSSRSKDKVPSKESLPHKFPILKAKQIPKVDEASDQII